MLTTVEVNLWKWPIHTHDKQLASNIYWICFRTIPNFNPQGTHFPHREKTELLRNHVHSNLISTWVSRGCLQFWISFSCIFSLVYIVRSHLYIKEPESHNKLLVSSISNIWVPFLLKFIEDIEFRTCLRWTTWYPEIFFEGCRKIVWKNQLLETLYY